MPQCSITGRDRMTGEERLLTVPAPTEAEARRVVGRSVNIAMCWPVDEDRDEPQRGAEPAAAGTPAYPSADVPDYAGILLAARLLGVVGFVFVVGGLLSLVAGWVWLASGREVDAAAGAGWVTNGIIGVGFGVLMWFAGSIGRAVRDIARNSFRK